MNKFFVYALAIVLAGFSFLNAENVEINLTKSYALDVWYSPKVGVVKTEPKDNWDLAFQMGQKAAIMINSQRGMKLWYVPNSDYDTYSTKIDTNGMTSTWEACNNSVETWDIGAFNMGKDGFVGDGNFGWGSYNMANHSILGDKVFVIKVDDKTYKKIVIESLIGGIYTVKWANFDGSDEITVDVSKVDYATKNFVYLTMADKKIIDREPESIEWALLFGKYTGMVTDQNGNKQAYTVTGVRTNGVYRVAKVTGSDPYKMQTPELNDDNYAYEITTIGDNWKKINSDFITYSITPNVAYFFTRSQNGIANPVIDKIIFTSFAGSSTGKLTFDLNPTASVAYDYNNSNIKIYPVIIENNKQFNLDYSFDVAPENMKIDIIGTNGVTAISETIKSASQKASLNVSVNDLPAGCYIVSVNADNKFYSYKIVIK